MNAKPRTIRVEALSRVEGEGGLHLHFVDGDLADVRLEIYEPPRLFEALLRGRHFAEAPDITARICGICPIAYQMSAVHAIESALGCQPDEEIRGLRRLLYCGEWIESHALHIHLLHAPDFVGYESGLAMAADFPEEIKRGLRLKKHGNQLLELFGGRAIHPINVAVGGFYRLPRVDAVQRLIPDFEWGVQAAVEVVRWVAKFDFQDFARPAVCVALHHPDEYPLNEGRIRSSSGLDIGAAEFAEHFDEFQVPHSTALHCRISNVGDYLVGPLARVRLNYDRLAPAARRLGDQLKVDWDSLKPQTGIIARGLEVVHAYAEALERLRAYRHPRRVRADVAPCAAVGSAATEAPRGLLYHRYRLDSEGTIVEASIVPPTSQNQAQIEADLRYEIRRNPAGTDEQLAHRCERLVRSYDPCISCSTHFLRLSVTRC